jgi:glycosyltransferase involved in cell wall biosynthesis
MVTLIDDNMGYKKIMVMVPAFNEAEKIGEVIKSIPRKINDSGICEVMVMDDHSTDDTPKIAKEAGAEYIFRQKQNVGLGKNFKKGIEMALKLGADIIVNIDGDGQFDAKDIPDLVRPIIHNEADMVTVSRFLDPSLTENMPYIKKWGNRRFTRLINKITGQKFTDVSCGFRAYSKEAALRLNLQGKFTYTQEVFIDLAEKGLRIKEIPSKVTYYEKRKSIISSSLRRYGFKSLAIIAKATRDTQPLTFFGMPALMILLLGLLGGFSSFVYWLIYHMTTPIRTLFNVSVFFMIFGLALGILAMIADMLKTLKTNQEEILYMMKKTNLENAKIFTSIDKNINHKDKNKTAGINQEEIEVDDDSTKDLEIVTATKTINAIKSKIKTENKTTNAKTEIEEI